MNTATDISLELRNRLKYGFAAAAGVILIIFLLGHEATLLMALIAALQGWREYSRMMAIKDRMLYFYAGFPVLAVMFIQGYFVREFSLAWIWFVWVLGFVLLYFDHRVRKKENEHAALDPLGEWTALCRFVMGVIYIFLIFGYIGPIVGKARIGVQLLVLGFSVVFVGDTGAYFVGRRYGKTKLWPEISPKKTVEGAVGGLVASILAAIVIWAIFRPFAGPLTSPMSLGACLFAGLVGAPLGQAGDLLESLMKRAAGAKDSGSLLPGHGGILDRADGLAFFLPFLYYFF